jgi:hypothetical protein
LGIACHHLKLIRGGFDIGSDDLGGERAGGVRQDSSQCRAVRGPNDLSFRFWSEARTGDGERRSRAGGSGSDVDACGLRLRGGNESGQWTESHHYDGDEKHETYHARGK